ncbi:metal-dependent hydrolase [Oerskovia sp. NPDC060338]|uniref:metal-dependent hydrolase n=1 Tax=Oerskovia sp. NPDC060338 TaxID=3347100 RepID=UPI003666C133
MMGGHHAATGAAAWVAVSATAPYALGLYPASPLGVAAGALVCAGAALLPDADHHSATIAHALPPFSGPICRGIGKISGGHRHGTHSILGVLAFTVIAWAVGLLTVTVPELGELAVGSGLFSLILVAFAAKALKFARGGGTLAPWLLSLPLAVGITVFAPTEWYWLPAAVGIGAFVHLLGDALTTGGVPFLWPWVPKPPRWWASTPVLNRCWQPNGYLGAPILGNAGSVREWILLVPISLYAIVGIVEATATGVVGVAPGWVMEAAQRLIEGRPS